MNRLSVLQLALACALLALAAVSPARGQQTVLEVITLKYRSVDQVIPVLQPLMAPQGTITGLNNQLILRTTPSNLAQLKQVLASLDATPRQLLITVRQDADLEHSRSSEQLSGQVGVGDHVTVTVPGRPTPPGATVSVDGARAKVYRSDAKDTDRMAQQVRVLEGSRAFIRVGQSVPVRRRQVVDVPGGRRVIETTGFSEVASGFYVLPRLSGDRVTLDIFTANDSLQSSATGTANVQRVQTRVSGRLGEWIEIGAVGQQGTQFENQVTTRSADARRDLGRVMLRVDEVN